jgi:hypothetical protein
MRQVAPKHVAPEYLALVFIFGQHPSMLTQSTHAGKTTFLSLLLANLLHFPAHSFKLDALPCSNSSAAACYSHYVTLGLRSL